MRKATTHFEKVPVAVVIKIAEVDGGQSKSGEAARKVRKKKAVRRQAGKRAAGKRGGG